MVEKDISDFLAIFTQTPQTLTDFSSLWREKNMSCALYCSPNPKERTDYIRELYEYLVVGIDLCLLAGKGPFLLLYSYFTLQPPNPWQRVNIPITKPEFIRFKSSIQAFRSCQEYDVVYAFNKLLAVHAFEFIPSHDSLIWGAKLTPKERFIPFPTIEGPALPPATAIKTLFDDGSVVKKLESLSLNYSEVKEKVETGKTFLECVTMDMPGKIKELEKIYREDIEHPAKRTELRKQKENMKVTCNNKLLNKRKEIKDKAKKLNDGDRRSVHIKNNPKQAKSVMPLSTQNQMENVPPPEESYIPFPGS